MPTTNNDDMSLANDPYERFIQQQKYQNNLIEIDKSSKFSKKINKLKVVMKQAGGNMLNGAMMGFMVGGLFGFVVGCYSAFQTRRLITIPMSVLISGGSFGFILGMGSVVRSDTLLAINNETQVANGKSEAFTYNVQTSEELTQLAENQWKNVHAFNQKCKLNKKFEEMYY